MSNVVAEGRLGPLVENTAAWSELKSKLSETPASQAISSNELDAMLKELADALNKPRMAARSMELGYALAQDGVEMYGCLRATDMGQLRAAGFNGADARHVRVCGSDSPSQSFKRCA